MDLSVILNEATKAAEENKYSEAISKYDKILQYVNSEKLKTLSKQKLFIESNSNNFDSNNKENGLKSFIKVFDYKLNQENQSKKIYVPIELMRNNQIRCIEEIGRNFGNPGGFTSRFKITSVDEKVKNILINIDLLEFKICDETIEITNFGSLNPEDVEFKQLKKPPYKLLHSKNSEKFLWVSLFAREKEQNKIDRNFIKIGYGYTMDHNVLFKLHPKSEKAREYLYKIATTANINTKGVTFEKTCENQPFLTDFDPVLFVPNDNNVTIEQLKNNLVTIDKLPKEAKQLYDIVKNFSFENPLLIEAIDHSIKTNGCLLNEKLKTKSSFSTNSKMSYLRIPLGINFGNQPGQPFVLEIWPPGHNSPIHNHGNAIALIKVLSGTIKVRWFNPLTEKCPEIPEEIKSASVNTGQMSWMTPNYYQTHQLVNETDTTVITLQSYVFSEINEVHGETFNYILPEKDELNYFIPNSDFDDPLEFEKIIIQEYLNSNNESVKILYKGISFQIINNFTKAIECFNKLIDLNKYKSLSYNNKGLCLKELKHYDEAIKCFDEAIKLEPNNTEYFINKGNVVNELKNYDDNIKLIDMKIQSEPFNPEDHAKKGNYLKYLRRYDEALACFNKAIELEKDNALFYEGKGNALKELEKYDESIKCFDKAIELEPTNAFLYVNKGNALKKIPNRNEAKKCFEKALELEPNKSDFHVSMGLCCFHFKEFEQAIECFDKAREIDEKIYFIKANCYLDGLNNRQKAKDCYNEAIERFPKNKVFEIFLNVLNIA